MRAAAAAVCFLTRLPLGRALTVDGDDLARAGSAFPLVGTAVGASIGAVALLLVHPLGAWLAAVLALAAGTLLTGALHLDGLADSADALSARSRERALELMRDHAIGSYGGAALVLDLLLKAGALTALAAKGDVLRVAVVAGALSRAAPVLLAAALPYARTDAGLGTSLTQGGRGRAAVAVVLAAGIAVAVAGAGDGAVSAAAAAAVTALVGLGCRRRFRGVTGDTLGATVELSEIAVLLTAVGMLGAR
ncbi:MAG: adenosylcobinamide-GDP ribazoletransferase [Thermoleophilia bacterium]|nr:adenosylcobinamide-GDP ribazoletransferase [Thermoleophilia bacterium]